jgi:acetyl esterase
MSFDPDVLTLFGLLAASGAKPISGLTVEEARNFYSAKTGQFGGPAAPVAEIRDLAASGSAGDIPLRLYRPEGADSPGPALIYVHGGGFVIGGFDSHGKVCRAIAAGTPCRVVAIDYRLAPEHPFPAGHSDVLDAVSWIAREAPTLGIVPHRLAIGGDSAGGNLSAVTCLYAREKGLKLAAQVLIYPSTDNTSEAANWPSRVENAEIPPLTADALRWFSSKFLRPPFPDPSDWRLSPLHAESLAGLPPALVLTAGLDPLRDEGKAYAERLREAGGIAQYRNFQGQIHGFLEYGGVIGAAAEAIREIAGFLRAQF